MSNPGDFIIENGVLTKYVGPGGVVAIPDGVTEIGKDVFYKNDSLTSVIFPDSLKIVGSQAFASCGGLTSIAIPRGVTEIRFHAFAWCKNLKDVFISDLESWCRIEFGGLYANCGSPLFSGARLHVNGEILKELVIPDKMETVNDYAFYACTSLKSVEISKGITGIGNYGFFKCKNLKRVSIPDGVTAIGNGAFAHCKKITEITIPKTVKSIGAYSFSDCPAVTDIVLPEGVEILGDEAFGNCGELRVSLPGTLKRPKKDDFGRLWKKAPFAGSTCSIRVEKWSALLTKMTEGCKIEEIITKDYALIPAEILLPVAAKMMNKTSWDPVSDIGRALLNGLSKCAEKQRSTVMTDPNWLQLLCDNKLLKAKELDAYLEEAEKQQSAEAKAILLNYQNSLGNKSVEKAREKKEKEAEAYEDALVERAATRDPAKGIEGMTFVITGKLKAWPKVWSSKEEVQEYLAKYGAVLGASVSKQTDYLVTNDADSGSAKNEKARRLGVEVITEEVFNQIIGRRFIDEEKICVPEWLTSIEPAAFSFPDWESWKSHAGYKKLREVVIPETITSIGDKAFAGAENLESIILPNGIEHIGAWAFAGCSKITGITLPDKLISIGARAFDACSNLKRITVPDGVKVIGIGAFGNCTNLEEVNLPSSVEQIELMAFDGCPKLTIYAPEGSFSAGYARRNGLPLTAIGEESAPASDGSGEFMIENGVLVKYLGSGGDVIIPDGVSSIAPMAFYGCLSLTSVNIPEGVTSISFSGCSNLKKITLPNSITSFGYGALFNCSSLAELTIPESVTQIGKQAFYGCSSLKKLAIPGNVKEIAEEAFSGCSGLETLIISEGVEIIGKNEFFLCNSLKDIYVPASLQKIDRNNDFYRRTIHAPAKSYAEKYAKRNKIAFEVWETE